MEAACACLLLDHRLGLHSGPVSTQTVFSLLHCCSAFQTWQATLADADAPGHISNAEPFQQMHAHLEQSFPLVYQKLKHERVGGTCCSTSGCWVSPSALNAPAVTA